MPLGDTHLLVPQGQVNNQYHKLTDVFKTITNQVKQKKDPRWQGKQIAIFPFKYNRLRFKK